MGADLEDDDQSFCIRQIRVIRGSDFSFFHGLSLSPHKAIRPFGSGLRPGCVFRSFRGSLPVMSLLPTVEISPTGGLTSRRSPVDQLTLVISCRNRVASERPSTAAAIWVTSSLAREDGAPVNFAR